jgi:hypothetical protein
MAMDTQNMRESNSRGENQLLTSYAGWKKNRGHNTVVNLKKYA